ncbi:MAG: phosphatidylglycerophosphatase A, partial [Pseudomonadota bacterium]|nr:phosphatidylglycerophosphatase A [Pseudomonadota bacterium]
MGTNTSALSLNQLAKPSVLWLTFFGAGLLRPAPGTWGSVVALAVWWWGLSEWPVLTQGLVVVVYTLVSWWVCAKFLHRTGLHDEPQIVADEVAGLWLALVFVPVTWWAGLLAFALFRLF